MSHDYIDSLLGPDPFGDTIPESMAKYIEENRERIEAQIEEEARREAQIKAQREEEERRYAEIEEKWRFGPPEDYPEVYEVYEEYEEWLSAAQKERNGSI